MSAQKESWKFPWHLIFIFLIFSFGMLTAGYFYYKHQEVYIRQEKQNELAAIIALKTDQIISWRQERIDYAITIMDDPFFALPVKDLMKGKSTNVLKRQIIARMTALSLYQYYSLVLVDPQGNVRLSVPESKQFLPPYLKTLAHQAMQEQKVVFSDLYQDEGSKVMLSILAPILFPQKSGKVAVGALLMKIEPYQFLYPLIKSWPTPSLTGESELVRREGDEVVFLNELRHQKNIPLNLRFSINEPNSLEAKVAQGKKGIVEGLDYRGAPVLGAAGNIPDLPWLLIAKVDTAEIFAPLQKRFRELGFLIIALIAGTGMGIAYFWRNQQIMFYRRQYEVEHERRALAERYEYLSRFANDIILVADQNLKIVEANNRAVASYGYKRDELLNLHLADLYPPDSAGILDGIMQHLADKGGLIFETMHQRRDGSTFPVEVSLVLLEVEGQKLIQGITRDITERKRADKALKESEKNLRYFASQLLSAQEDERKRISRELHDELGHALLALKLQLESVEEQLRPKQVSLREDIRKILGFTGATIEKVRRLYLDLSPGDLEDLGLTGALLSLIEDFAELQKKIKWTIQVENLDGLFALPVQIAIYRVVQEALTNIGKHAKPINVFLEIKREKQGVCFTVEDDGAGFDKNKVFTEKKTLGLLAMEERVKILGGSFELRSEENRGTRIAFTIPVPGGEK